jgi:hypothetical protein
LHAGIIGQAGGFHEPRSNKDAQYSEVQTDEGAEKATVNDRASLFRAAAPSRDIEGGNLAARVEV